MRATMLIIATCLLLAACGKKGAPQPPGPKEDITYPKVYPAY